jgi:hypothetical protein
MIFWETARSKFHLLYESEYVIPCVGNLTEEKPWVSMSESPIGV